MAQLARASFHWTHLEGAVLDETDLERATFNQSLLEGASLRAAYLPRVFLSGAFLMGADLEYAHLKEAILRGALLMGARLTAANLEGANLRGAHMDGMVYAPDEPSLARVRQFAPNFPATLSPADLSGAFFDSATDLYGAVLATAKRGAVRVADVRWGGVNLAVVPDWAPFTEQKVPLGDERAAWEWKPEPFTETAEQQKQPQRTRRQARTAHDQQQARERRVTFQAAVRANRQLATALRGQGMNEEADYFAYRAQVVQRQVQRQQGIRKWPVYIGSFILDLIAGYGYHPERSFLVYLAAIVWFANAYRLFGGLPPLDASVFSMASFHGRGFFPSESFTLHSPVAILAGVEAFFGLLIEITFIATFTQRFFAR